MKIKIQYPAGPNITPAQIEVETDDSGLEPSEQLQHASDALDVALKVVWAEKARPTEPASKAKSIDFGAGYVSIVPGNDRDAFIKTLQRALTGVTDAEGRPLFKVMPGDAPDSIKESIREALEGDES